MQWLLESLWGRSGTRRQLSNPRASCQVPGAYPLHSSQGCLEGLVDLQGSRPQRCSRRSARGMDQQRSCPVASRGDGIMCRGMPLLPPPGARRRRTGKGKRDRVTLGKVCSPRDNSGLAISWPREPQQWPTDPRSVESSVRE